ncbi:MAG: hypothetical protein V4726_15315 [Verrucomicrobiota bacterium]
MSSAGEDNPGSFPRTRWSLVLEAQEDDPAALAALCRAYWFPLYCYARRLGHGLEDAQDLTQGFFEMLLTRQALKQAREDRGKLRAFLLTSLKHFSAERHRHRQAGKRGGGKPVLEFDAMEAEQRYALEPRDELSPEREFDRAWARQLLASVLEKLGEAYRSAGKAEVFLALQDHLTGGGSEDYGRAAAALGLSPAGVRYAAFKLRERYRALLRAAIQQTVTTETEIGDELQHLRAIFGN